MKKLTTIAVQKLMRKQGRHAVGDGAYLQVQGGGRSWLFRYERNGTSKYVGLGSCALVSLAEAREKALTLRRQLRDGIDPIADREATRQKAAVDAAKGTTFREAAERYIAAHEAGWSNPVHRRQWSQTLTTDVYPILADLPVSAIDTARVTDVLEPIWAAKPETASRIRGRIEAVLDWAKARGYREGENPARWRGHLDQLLPHHRKVKRVVHHPALRFTDVPAFMAELRQQGGVVARALEFTILTAARVNEVIGARWSEISGDVWTVPADRMKGGREHRVPLSKSALKLLSDLPRNGDLIFPSEQSKAQLTNGSMLKLLRRQLRRPGITVHGFRSSFRDWAGETTAFPNHVVEMALAHAIGKAVEASYRRGDLLDKRTMLMTAWSDYCGKPVPTGATVTAIGSKRRRGAHA